MVTVCPNFNVYAKKHKSKDQNLSPPSSTDLASSHATRLVFLNCQQLRLKWAPPEAPAAAASQRGIRNLVIAPRPVDNHFLCGELDILILPLKGWTRIELEF